jgi:hypothetical protein
LRGAVNLTTNSAELNSQKEIEVGAQFFFAAALELGNMSLMAQRLTKSTIDRPYEQFMHTVLWII